MNKYETKTPNMSNYSSLGVSCVRTGDTIARLPAFHAAATAHAGAAGGPGRPRRRLGPYAVKTGSHEDHLYTTETLLARGSLLF